MSEFPLGFDYKTLTTDEDRELRELALAQYSEDAADCIIGKYEIDNDDWPDYKRKVRELITRKLPEAEFIEALDQIGQETALLDL